MSHPTVSLGARGARVLLLPLLCPRGEDPMDQHSHLHEPLCRDVAHPNLVVTMVTEVTMYLQ